MAAAQKTGFDKFVAEQLRRPRFAAEYARARAEVRAVDDLIRALDEQRVAIGMTKAELARRVSASPEVVRRLLTAEDANPTMETVLRMAEAVGLRVALEPIDAPSRLRQTRDRRRKTARSKRHAHAAA
jgi:DNA-binding phage protein